MPKFTLKTAKGIDTKKKCNANIFKAGGKISDNKKVIVSK